MEEFWFSVWAGRKWSWNLWIRTNHWSHRSALHFPTYLEFHWKATSFSSFLQCLYAQFHHIMEWLEDTKIDNRDSIYNHFKNLINFLIQSQKHGSNAKHDKIHSRCSKLEWVDSRLHSIERSIVLVVLSFCCLYLFFSQLPAPKIQWSTVKLSSLQTLEHLAIPPRNIYIYIYMKRTFLCFLSLKKTVILFFLKEWKKKEIS